MKNGAGGPLWLVGIGMGFNPVQLFQREIFSLTRDEGNPFLTPADTCFPQQSIDKLGGNPSSPPLPSKQRGRRFKFKRIHPTVAVWGKVGGGGTGGGVGLNPGPFGSTHTKEKDSPKFHKNV